MEEIVLIFIQTIFVIAPTTLVEKTVKLLLANEHVEQMSFQRREVR